MKILFAAIASWFMLSLCPALVFGEAIKIRFSHVVAEDTPKGKGANLFKKRVEERLAGRVEVSVFPNSKLFNDDQVFLALLVNDLQLAAPSLAKFSDLTKTLQVFDLPFLFDDIAAVERFQDGELGQGLLSSMTHKGIQGLTYWHNGMRVMSDNKPLRLPTDVQGLRFRIEPSDVLEAQFRELGALTVRLPFQKVYDALRSGLVDGQENTWSNIYSQKIHTVQSHFTETNHSYLGYMVVTSKEFWEGLPNDIRSKLEEILTEVTLEVNRIALEQAENDRQQVIDSDETKVLTLSKEERATWRETLIPIWEQFEDEIGQEVIEAAQAADIPD